MTYSIAALSRETGEIGVAVATCAFAVGAVVPWAQPGVGAVATQSFTNPQYGPDGLALLAQGLSPQAVIARLTEPDSGRKARQVGVLAADGRSAHYTGANCFPWCGGISGQDFTAQGNMLAGAAVVEAMAESFRASSGPLYDRLFVALEAAEAAGGDRRGRQSAALLVLKEGGYSGGRQCNLRVDDHAQPLPELGRLLRIWKEGMLPRDWVPYTPSSLLIIQVFLQRQGLYSGEIGPVNAATLEGLRRQAVQLGMGHDHVREDAVSGPLMQAMRERMLD